MFGKCVALWTEAKLQILGLRKKEALGNKPLSKSEKLFWMSPELVESLLPLLDITSITMLAKTHPLTIGIVQRGLNWSRIIKRNWPPEQALAVQEPFAKRKNAAVRALEPIIEVLHLMGKPESQLLELLHIICRRFPSNKAGALPDLVKVSCQCHEVSHDVSSLGFVLLEFVENSTGTSYQQVLSVYVWNIKHSIFPSLKSRLPSSGGKIGQIRCIDFGFDTQEDAETFLALAKEAESVVFRRLVVRGSIGEGGWAALAEALRLLPPMVPLLLQHINPQHGGEAGFHSFVVSSTSPSPRNIMQGGRRSDLRAIFDAIPVGRFWHTIHGPTRWLDRPTNHHQPSPTIQKRFRKWEEADWGRMEQYMDNAAWRDFVENLAIKLLCMADTYLGLSNVALAVFLCIAILYPFCFYFACELMLEPFVEMMIHFLLKPVVGMMGHFLFCLLEYIDNLCAVYLIMQSGVDWNLVTL